MKLPDIPHHNHPRRSIYIPGRIYFITTVVGDRAMYFEDARLRFIFLKALTEASVMKDYKILAFALLPDHVHLILKIGGFSNSKIMHSLKKHVSREINKTLDIDIFRWQHSFRDYLIRDEKEFCKYFYYTVRNPLNHKTSGFVWSVANSPKDTISAPNNESFIRNFRDLLKAKLEHYRNDLDNSVGIIDIDKKINNLIYKMYDLTDEEIRIIEG